MEHYQMEQEVRQEVLYTPLTREDIEKKAILDFLKEIPLEDLKEICKIKVEVLDPNTSKIDPNTSKVNQEYLIATLNRLRLNGCFLVRIENHGWFNVKKL